MSNLLSDEQLENAVASDRVIVLKNPNKTKHTVQPAMDPKTRWYAGVPRLSDSDKNDMHFHTSPESKITLEDGIRFDLNNDVDRANWEWLKHLKEISPDLEGYLSNPSATFYVYIEGREARKKNNGIALTFQAQKFVFEDSPVNYEDKAMLLGFDMTGENPETVKEFLLDQASEVKSAKKVIEVYTSNALSTHLLYLKAKRKGIITTTDGLNKFGMQVLGVTDETSIAFLQEAKNSQVRDLLDQNVNPEYYEEKAEIDATRVEKPVTKKVEAKTTETKSESKKGSEEK